MSVEALHFGKDEPPSTRTQQVTQRSCQLLLYVFCLAPIALFPVGLAWKVFEYFFP
ncbi:MAG: hypothetical protein JOY64_25510 [Alphaproteobacteria bacterium]|nr:hypothetical protein [Alphaproteobacteria bacterium]MBV8411010.1 hypothetical protein [Alphaproteobacteria bacterium]